MVDMKPWLQTIICGVFLLWSSVAQAHDGPHGPDMLAEVVSAQVNGNSVTVKVRVTNLGGPLVLTGMNADGAVPIRLAPVYLDFAEDKVASGTLQFNKSPGRGFTLILDFGVVGQGAVTVIPKNPNAPVSR